MPHTLSKILPAAFAGMLALSGCADFHPPTPAGQAETTATAPDKGTSGEVDTQRSPQEIKQFIAHMRAKLAKDVATSCSAPLWHPLFSSTGPFSPLKEILVMQKMQIKAKASGLTLDQYIKKEVGRLIANLPLSDPGLQRKLDDAASYLHVNQDEVKQLYQAFENAGVSDLKTREALVNYEIYSSYASHEPAACIEAIVKQRNYEAAVKRDKGAKVPQP